MGFDPASMMFMAGAAQGVGGFMGGQSKAAGARANADVSRQWAAYSKKKSLMEIARIQAEEERQTYMQKMVNNAVFGNFFAKVGGTSGTAVTGSTLDASANQVAMGVAKIMDIKSDSLLQQARATNIGNEEQWKYLSRAQMQDFEADQHETQSYFALATGIGKGVLGAQGATYDPATGTSSWGFSDIWNKWENPFSGTGQA
tara:strand:- start:3244 stop:3846 length:603 start_codon:yes stop_codon:yes gene_type:complete